MKRDAETMDSKDWIILRLMREMATSSLTDSIEYHKTTLWIAANLDIWGGPNDPIDCLYDELRASRAGRVNLDLATNEPCPPECVIATCMEYGK